MAFTNPTFNIEQLNLKEGNDVAIFGSGAGGHSFAATSALRGGGRVFAIDVRKEMLQKVENEAKEKGISELKTVLGNVELNNGSHLRDLSIDAVVIPNTLFSYDDKPAILSEAFRITKPNGQLLIIDWIDSFAGTGPAPENIVPEEEAKRLAEKAGFTNARRFNAGDHHYGFVFGKR